MQEFICWLLFIPLISSLIQILFADIFLQRWTVDLTPVFGTLPVSPTLGLGWNETVIMGHSMGLWWPEKVKVLCLVLCLQWKGVWLRREFFLNLCDPSFITKTSPLTCHLADEESPQPIHTPEEVTTPFRRSRQTFQYLFIFSRQKNRQNLFFFVIEIICVPCRYFSKCRQSYQVNQ